MQCNLLWLVVLSLTSLTLLKIRSKINKRTEGNLRVFCRDHAACSMQQDISDVFDIPWILQEFLSRKPVLAEKFP